MRFDWDMADFAGRAAIAMHQHAVFDDARSQSGAEVQERNGTGHAVRTAQYGGRADGGGIDVVSTWAGTPERCETNGPISSETTSRFTILPTCPLAESTVPGVPTPMALTSSKRPPAA